MSRSHRSRLPVGLAFASILFLASSAFADPGASPRSDPLAVGKLESEEVTLHFEDMNIAVLFRAIARVGQVPFILDFENDPTLKVSFKAEHMSLRTILQSLADAYGLEYEASDAGIVVRRRGAPGVATPGVVGAWPPKPGPLYELALETRDAQGEVVASPSTVVTTQTVWSYTQATKRMSEVTAFDQQLLIAAPRFVGSIRLNLCVKRETSAGLELLLEVVTERPLGNTRYAEEHTVVSKTAGPGETLLFKTEDGHQIVLKRWAREAGKRTSEAGREPGADRHDAEAGEA